MTKHLKVGSEGEDTAARYLISLGYEIRESNVRFKKYELDIVAYDPAQEMMVFVEVKTRTTASEAYPIRTTVDRRKRESLRKGVARWVTSHNYDGPGRIDIVCISGSTIVEHLTDIGSDFF